MQSTVLMVLEKQLLIEWLLVRIYVKISIKIIFFFLNLDCGIELKKSNVAFVGLQLGTVKTEYTTQMIKEKGDNARLPLDPNSLFLNVYKKMTVE
jgi:hypothetical protein